jgi:hypothetical protein
VRGKFLAGNQAPRGSAADFSLEIWLLGGGGGSLRAGKVAALSRFIGFPAGKVAAQFRFIGFPAGKVAAQFRFIGFPIGKVAAQFRFIGFPADNRSPRGV